MTTGSAMQLQHLRVMKITPQLRQAIGLLNFNNRTLAAFIRIQASSNPYLKITAAGEPPRAAESDRPEPSRHLPAGVAGHLGGEGGGDHWEQSIAAPAAGLQEHVRRQIDLSIRDPHQKAIAFFLTEALEPSGWLGRPVAKLAEEACREEEEVEAVLTILQGFEPAGLFARSLAECLRLQAIEAGVLTETLALVLDNLELVGRGDIQRLAQLGKTTQEAIVQQVKIIRRFNPKPGAAFDSVPAPVLPPDLLVEKLDGDWQLDLNRSNLPSITVRDVPDRDVPEAIDREGLLAEARWLEKAVARRNVTTLTVAAEIVRRQTGFLAHGPARLAPMSLADIADAVSMHESTVSRVTAHLMMGTPRGTVRLRDFFSVGLPSEQGDGSVSASAVREKIRGMIGREDAGHPLSDEALAARLKGEGISIARRTVAKYRDALKIPGSPARKRRARLEKSRGAG